MNYRIRYKEFVKDKLKQALGLPHFSASSCVAPPCLGSSWLKSVIGAAAAAAAAAAVVVAVVVVVAAAAAAAVVVNHHVHD